jgi:hypothetical protein
LQTTHRGLPAIGSRNNHGCHNRPPVPMTHPMTDELFLRAAPPCRQCADPALPVTGSEHCWHRDEDGEWRLRWFTVCARGHRVLVEPFM